MTLFSAVDINNFDNDHKDTLINNDTKEGTAQSRSPEFYSLIRYGPAHARLTFTTNPNGCAFNARLTFTTNPNGCAFCLEYMYH